MARALAGKGVFRGGTEAACRVALLLDSRSVDTVIDTNPDTRHNIFSKKEDTDNAINHIYSSTINIIFTTQIPKKKAVMNRFVSLHSFTKNKPSLTTMHLLPPALHRQRDKKNGWL